MRNALRAAAAALGVLAFASAPASGDEGMWTFDNFPSARMQAELGWAPDQAWLDRVNDGRGALAWVFRVERQRRRAGVDQPSLRDRLREQPVHLRKRIISRDGFMARTREEERRCPSYGDPGSRAHQQRNREYQHGDRWTSTPETFARMRDAEIARLEGACSNGAHRCEVVTLYQGGRYALYEYKRFDDVRMVFAPEHQIAAFGGDPDNYNFPRYCLDFAFLRLYENGAPAATPQHLSMRFTPLTEDEIVLTTGNPGVTSRLRTTSEFAFQRDIQLPWVLNMLVRDARTDGLLFGSKPRERSHRFERVAGRGEFDQAIFRPAPGAGGLRTSTRVTAAEHDLRARVRRNAASAREVGDAWGEIARAQSAYRGMF